MKENIHSLQINTIHKTVKRSYKEYVLCKWNICNRYFYTEKSHVRPLIYRYLYICPLTKYEIFTKQVQHTQMNFNLDRLYFSVHAMFDYKNSNWQILGVEFFIVFQRHEKC